MSENSRPTSPSPASETTQDRDRLVAERRAKLDLLRAGGFAYQNSFERHHVA